MKRGFKTPLTALPADVKERLEAEGLVGTILLDFDYPPLLVAVRCSEAILVSVLAETLLEQRSGQMAGRRSIPVLGRIGCWVSGGIHSLTWVALVRCGISSLHSDAQSAMLVEEATAIVDRRRQRLEEPKR
jgi:hypothetical protein